MERLGDALGDQLQDLVEDDGRADRAASVEQRVEPRVDDALAARRASVVDGHCRDVGERFDQAQVGGAELAMMAMLGELEDAQYLAVEDDGREQSRLLAPVFHARLLRGAGVVDLRDHDGLLGEHTRDIGMAVEVVLAAHPLAVALLEFEGPEGLRDQARAVGEVLVDAAFPDVESEREAPAEAQKSVVDIAAIGGFQGAALRLVFRVDRAHLPPRCRQPVFSTNHIGSWVCEVKRRNPLSP